MVMQLISLGRVKKPLKNEPYTKSMISDNMSYISENLYKRISQTPELVSMLDKTIMDHFMSPIDFFDPNGEPLNSDKLKQVKLFWEDNNIQHTAFYGQAGDFFIDGSCFGWHVSANNILSLKQKEAISKIKSLNFNVGKSLEESSNMIRAISYLPASTVDIKHDEFDDVYYIQRACGKQVRWDINQVVHIKNMEWNGRIRGFTPLKALTKEILIMYMLKDNIIAKLQNGGSADNIIYIKGANGVSKSRFKRLETALESFSHLRKSHGNMPIDADVGAIPLGTALKDMEYRELSMFIISEFGLSLGLPTSRIPFMMTGSGGTSNKGELSGNSEDSYQTTINSRRMNWENSWNKVFRKAGFTFKYRRTNLQDSVRETQASTQRASFVSEVQNSLMKSGKKLKIHTHLALLSGSKTNLTEEDVEEMSEQDKMMGAGQSPIAGQGGSMQPSNIDSKSKVSQDKSAAKEKTASNNERYR